MQNKTIPLQYLSLFPQGTKITLIPAYEKAIPLYEEYRITDIYREMLLRFDNGLEDTQAQLGADLIQSITHMRNNINESGKDFILIEGDLHTPENLILDSLYEYGIIFKGNVTTEGIFSAANNEFVAILGNITAQNLLYGSQLFFVNGNARIEHLTADIGGGGNFVVNGTFSTTYYYLFEDYPLCRNNDGDTLCCINAYNKKGYALVEEVRIIGYPTLNSKVLCRYLDTGKTIFRGNPEEYVYSKTFKNGCIE